MEIIDNLNKLLGDDIKATLTPGSKLRIAASTFSIYAFEALRTELEGVKELEFIFTAPTFVASQATDKVNRARREFYIPQSKRESSLYGSEFEIRLRNKLTQRAIARECAGWIKQKVTFKSNKTGAEMQQFAVIDDRTAYMPLQGFTSADLGYERGNAISNLVNKIDEAPLASAYLQTFDQIWSSHQHVEDVTNLVHEHIASIYAENSPGRIYFLILYNLFSEFLEDISEDVLPDDLTGWRDSQIWSNLYNFQRDAAIGIINKLETYNGCILADSVGLGKTFTALAVIKYYESRNKSVLVLAPKKLEDNWTTYNSPYVTNPFSADRFSYHVLAHTDLSRDKGYAGQLDLAKLNWGNFNLVVIDESHNFRNADYSEEKESRYQRLMRKVIQSGVKTKVLMLSATPVNNRFNDLKNQLQLAYEGESEQLSAKLDISKSIEQVFREAQVAFKRWSELDAEERTTEAILRMLDFDFFELLDAVTIARSRKHIQSFYDTADIGAFPHRLRPESLREPLTDLPQAPTFNEIFEQLQVLNLAVYTPLSYVYPSRMQKYVDRYAVQGGTARGNLGMAGREQGLKTLMTVNLLKRLESSVEAFRITLRKVEAAIDHALQDLDDKDGRIADIGAAFGDIEADDDDFEVPTAPSVGRKYQIDLEDMDTTSWRNDLWHDRETIRELVDVMDLITPDHDRKLQRLRQVISTKVEKPLNGHNKKVLLFSAFADTARYLYSNLEKTLHVERSLELGLVTGATHPKTTLGDGFDFQKLLTFFSPGSKDKAAIFQNEPGEIDVLIGTDCISEGQNLQDCDYVVNYDIHWNPVRIIQRFGRVDRIGSKNSVIQMVNFWPDISLDEYINLKERVENRMVIADLAATADDNLLSQESSDTQFRKEQLRRLQDEVIELEDVRTGVSITDLGLNDFRMDLLKYMEQYGDLASSPKGLHAVVPSNLERGLRPGVIFALRSIDDHSKINRHNRLHPHYLIYLDNNGNVITDHTEVKQLLDLIRASCQGSHHPIPAAYHVFNQLTREGAEMAFYSNLLNEAIKSLINVTEERDIDSLFSGAKTTALQQSFEGLDDFELIAFLAIVEPEVVDD
ncbi:DEAD/DEAH box helicase family protein [Tessaracoccus sp. SD287]|uniref:helicase-related protein n=1 Tax=Tessaracoccus sp. SD287 TaxID=2782008 RepID=UPI001A9595E4|nr:helicase-related protein [Tessaracoccus sp. SD287]MBO1031389.1 DEAD/DEAH box helicase family protein [Tessaracoccus sp. SD287]